MTRTENTAVENHAEAKGTDRREQLNQTLKQDGIEVLGTVTDSFAEILTPAALRFVALLARQFTPVRDELLTKRAAQQARIDAGEMPDFLPETKAIREGDWKVAPIPTDLADRRTEITGPVDRKMVINALNSGAKVYMADFEDAHSPGWKTTMEGQVNLRDAVRGTIEYVNPAGVVYQLKPPLATLLVRPRGWHLDEKHVRVDGKLVPGGIFDFALFFFHNAKALQEEGSGPYFYLPKIESHLEARLWNDIFLTAQEKLNVPRGTIRATVLIETILASFEMDEILYELREHSSGLNAGRWDYIFSTIKVFAKNPKFVFPDRAQVTMTTHFLRSYCLLLIRTCHRRGIHAMGGMAAQIPIKNDPAANEAAMAKVIADKEREVGDGHDGTWVAHPGLVRVAAKVFDKYMPGPHQIDRLREDVHVTAADLLQVPEGTITEQGLRTNLSVGVQYLEAWLRGTGCVPLYHLMEDAATSEISRAQVWQWIRHGARMEDGRVVTAELARKLLKEEMSKVEKTIGSEAFQAGQFGRAVELFEKLMTGRECAPFLTIPAYEYLD